MLSLSVQLVSSYDNRAHSFDPTLLFERTNAGLHNNFRQLEARYDFELRYRMIQNRTSPSARDFERRTAHGDPYNNMEGLAMIRVEASGIPV